MGFITQVRDYAANLFPLVSDTDAIGNPPSAVPSQEQSVDTSPDSFSIVREKQSAPSGAVKTGLWNNRSLALAHSNSSLVSPLSAPASPSIPTPPDLAADLDGDLLIENGDRDRIADIPMVELLDQRITIGLTPEVSKTVTSNRTGNFEASVQLTQNTSTQRTHLLSIEGGLNLKLGIGGSSTLSDGADRISRNNSHDTGLNFGSNNNNEFKYSRERHAEFQRVASSIDHSEQRGEITLSPNAGYISLQFTLKNSGTQTVVLHDPSFAVMSHLGRDGSLPRQLTVIPEQSIQAAQVSDPWLRAQALAITLAPGEIRTISLRLPNQSTSTIMEILRSSQAIWATLHFGRQTAVSDPILLADGTVIPGNERDISRDLISRIRKRTIPVYFEPPARGDTLRPLGHTSLISAARPNYVKDLGRPQVGITIPELLRLQHGQKISLEDPLPIKGADKSRYQVNQIGPVRSTLPHDIGIASLTTIPVEKLKQLGRWEIQVSHRDYGPIRIPDWQHTLLTPDHSVSVRWVDGATVLKRLRASKQITTRPLHVGPDRIDPVSVSPGSMVQIKLSTIDLDEPLLQSTGKVIARELDKVLWNYHTTKGGTKFSLQRLSSDLRQQLRFRYAIVSRKQAEAVHTPGELSEISWHEIPLAKSNSVSISIPTDMSVPEDAVLITNLAPISNPWKRGPFVQQLNNGRLIMLPGAGERGRQILHPRIEGQVEIVPPTKTPSNPVA